MKTYKIWIRMKPVQVVQAKSCKDAIEKIRIKFLNSFITRVKEIG